MWVIYISLIIFLLKLPVKFKVHISLKAEKKDLYLHLKVNAGILGMPFLKYQIISGSQEGILNNLIFKLIYSENKDNFGIKEIRHIGRMHRYFLSYVYIEKLKWNTVFGLANPAYTAWIIGGLWLLKGNVLSSLCSLTRVKKAYVKIQPDFMNGNKNSEIFCIAKVAIVHIIFIVIYVIYSKIRGFKYGTKRKRQ